MIEFYLQGMSLNDSGIVGFFRDGLFWSEDGADWYMLGHVYFWRKQS